MAQSKQLTRLENWHHDLIDWMLTNPRASGQEAARHFCVSPAWISIVKHSEIFKAELARRRRLVEADLSQRLNAAAEIGLEAVGDRLAKDGMTMPARDLRGKTEMLLKVIGVSGGRQPAERVTVNVETVSPETLAAARERMLRGAQERAEGRRVLRIVDEGV